MPSQQPDWLTRYLPPFRLNWQGKSDGIPGSERFHEIVACADLNKEVPCVPGRFHYTLAGFECDEGIARNQGRIGAAQGPLALRHALAALPVHINNSFSLCDVGDISCPNHDLEFSQHCLAQMVHHLVGMGLRPILVGGGHELVLGHYQGLAQAYPQLDCAFINFDAHLDIRPLVGDKGTSGTMFLQVAEAEKKRNRTFDYTCIGVQRLANTPALFEQASLLRATLVHAEEMHEKGLRKARSVIDALIDKHQHLFVTICMDVFATAFAPGVSSPQPLGLSPWQVIPLLRRLAETKKIIGFSIAEISPALDYHNVTARLGAMLLATYLEAENA